MPNIRPIYCRTTGALTSACHCIRCGPNPARPEVGAITVIHEEDPVLVTMVAISYESPILSIGGYATPAELRQLARRLNTIANDADQGATGQITYGQEAA
jgi:hypothetical protein